MHSVTVFCTVLETNDMWPYLTAISVVLPQLCAQCLQVLRRCFPCLFYCVEPVADNSSTTARHDESLSSLDVVIAGAAKSRWIGRYGSRNISVRNVLYIVKRKQTACRRHFCASEASTPCKVSSMHRACVHVNVYVSVYCF